MNRIIEISTCDGCPHMTIDDNRFEERWGKNWCSELDTELLTVEIPENCPLPAAQPRQGVDQATV